MAVLTPPACSFTWTIRNHPTFAECSDQWCDTHNAWRREQPPRDICEGVEHTEHVVFTSPGLGGRCVKGCPGCIAAGDNPLGTLHVHRWDALRSIPPSWRCRDCGEITDVRP